MFPLRAAGGAFSGTGRSAAAVSAAGSGLAEAWAKQMGQVSALIGHHVESVQARASQTASLHLGQRNGSVSTSDSPASSAEAAIERRRR